MKKTDFNYNVLLDMRKAAERELMMRKRLYPSWVLKGKMTEKKAQNEIIRIERIIEYIQKGIDEITGRQGDVFKKRPGYYVETKSGRKGRTYNDEPFFEKKIKVHLFADEDGISPDLDDNGIQRKLLCDPISLKILGMFE